jgi:hypothetical protein
VRSLPNWLKLALQLAMAEVAVLFVALDYVGFASHRPARRKRQSPRRE